MIPSFDRQVSRKGRRSRESRGSREQPHSLAAHWGRHYRGSREEVPLREYSRERNAKSPFEPVLV